MIFCSKCGHKNLKVIPDGDNRERAVCSECGFIHYENPRIICGCLPVYEDKVLLCKRAIEPRYGYWTLPAGFMENGETLEEGAKRESWEEAFAELDNLSLYTIFNIPALHQVHMFFKGDLIQGQHKVGDESLETQLYTEDEIPWDDLAFPTIGKSLKHFFSDRKTKQYPMRIEDLIRRR